ncbi:MAG: efflux RND transporter permease subunit [Thermoanaerobaculia bacterium]|nr:efflux RND transporter permease subunit [Thermoanaerobaculia bacterium]
MSLPKLAVTRPITTAMMLVSVLVFGGIALTRLPLAYLPEVDVPFIFIEVPYRNSNPVQVEREITKPVEEVLGTLSGIERMRSTSQPDSTRFFLEFGWGQELDIVRMQVSEKMDQVKAELPEDIGEIVIFSFNTNDIPVVQGRISAEGVDLSENYDLLEARVLNRLRRIPGVGRVTLDGVEPKEIFIDLRLDDVKEHNVEIERLIGQLLGSGSNMVLGRIEDGGKRYAARSLGNFGSVDELANLVIDERGLRLRDIADISYEEPPIRYGRHLNGSDAVALQVFKESTGNTVDVVNHVLDTIHGEIAEDPLLQGISLFMWENQADEITNSINGLSRAGMMGALLAVIVLYFFLRRLGSTLIVSLSIPFSVIATCGVLFFLGKTLNVLSMMGLMLGVGMLVDNAIVVLEAIDRRKREQPEPKLAALEGAGSVVMAVVASTLTSLIVFLPLIVGSKSQLTTWLGEVGLAIALALVCSLFSSLTLIPLMAGKFLPAGKTQSLRLFDWLEERYGRILSWTLRRKWATAAIIVFVALPVGFAPFALGKVKMEQFSATVNERIELDYDFIDFVYKSEAEDYVNAVEAALRPHLEDFGVESVYSYFASNEAGTILTLADQSLSDDQVKELRSQIREVLPEMPGVEVEFDDNEDESSGSTSFAFNIFGQDSSQIGRLADEAKRRLESMEGIHDVNTSLGRTRQEIEVQLDREKAARLGLTANDMSETFGFVLGGIRLPRFNDGRREVETSLALRMEDRTNLADLKEIQFRDIDGKPVLLGDIATFSVVDRPESIERENRQVRATVRATYDGEDWAPTRKKVEEMMNSFAFPTGYTWSWNARILEQDTQGQQMLINFLFAIAMVYLVMASLFESLTQPFAILVSTLFFALPGVGWLLFLTGTSFNLMGQIGLLILMGIVVNNGIVLLDHTNQLRADGMERHAAHVQAGRDRMRAVLMTASTTITGLIPLAIGGSNVSGLLYYPLAITVMGGLISSAVLTLLVLPYVNLLIENLSNWLRTLWRKSTPGRGTVKAGSPELAEPAVG